MPIDSMNTQRWTPDTCECSIEQQVTPQQPTPTAQFVAWACPAHADRMPAPAGFRFRTVTETFELTAGMVRGNPKPTWTRTGKEFTYEDFPEYPADRLADLNGGTAIKAVSRTQKQVFHYAVFPIYPDAKVAELAGVVTEECTRKNNLYAFVLENVPSATREVVDDDGTSTRRLRPDRKFNWSFDDRRRLVLDLDGFTQVEKTAVRARANADAPGKVVVS